ncbi:hypothetical protein BDM02DRAFT_323842 [Thelephora ganbajun]|uniref:Uncharacterized protein n=1 Tax=Thelephora ganbajun TaxID=370292 RepID=A0ACB6ZQ61_THEGA|nr:hypothetical protein BDM02DRAFT_323842 [Thelephora ganbajun]
MGNSFSKQRHARGLTGQSVELPTSSLNTRTVFSSSCCVFMGEACVYLTSYRGRCCCYRVTGAIWSNWCLTCYTIFMPALLFYTISFQRVVVTSNSHTLRRSGHSIRKQLKRPSKLADCKLLSGFNSH